MTDVLLIADRRRKGVPEAIEEVRRIITPHGRIVEELEADQRSRAKFEEVERCV